MALKTQKTGVWFVKVAGDVYSLVKVGGVSGVSGIGGGRSQIDVTDFDSDEMEYLPGMPNPGAVSVNLNFDPAIVSQQELEDLYNSERRSTWIVGLADGVPTLAPPTIDDETGVITWPTSRSYIEFTGYIADFPLDLAANDAIRSTMQVQRSGKRTLHRKSA